MLWVFSIRAKGSRGCPDCSYLFLFTTTTCPWIMDTTNLQRLQSNQRCSLFPERLSYMHVYAYLYVYIIIMIIIIVIIIIINNNNSNNNSNNNNNIIIIIYTYIYNISMCIYIYHGYIPRAASPRMNVENHSFNRWARWRPWMLRWQRQVGMTRLARLVDASW